MFRHGRVVHDNCSALHHEARSVLPSRIEVVRQRYADQRFRLGTPKAHEFHRDRKFCLRSFQLLSTFEHARTFCYGDVPGALRDRLLLCDDIPLDYVSTVLELLAQRTRLYDGEMT